MNKTPSKSPYSIIKHRYVTEKATVLNNLQHAESSATLKRCKNPKYVFVVDKKANKHEIAGALEKIYEKKKIRVVSVNTVNIPPKNKMVRGRKGVKSGYKKAIVTLKEGDTIEDQV